MLVTIQELAEAGMTCALVTHEMGFAREVANHIYFTDRGVIVEHGQPATFFGDGQRLTPRRAGPRAHVPGTSSPCCRRSRHADTGALIRAVAYQVQKGGNERLRIART